MFDRLMNRMLLVLVDSRGISAMEYAILAAAIIGAVTAATATVDEDLTSVFAALMTKLKTAAGVT